jgi:hypothetical protein
MTDIVNPSNQTVSNPKKSKLPLPAILAIGCMGFLVLIGIVFTIVGKVIFSKFGANLIKSGIENKTGIKVDTNSNTGSFTVTDSKTGSSMKIGELAVPSDFPKDFPLYPQAKPAGSLSGGKNQQQGYWLTLTTPDTIAQVKSFYDSNLKSKGWKIDATYATSGAINYTVSKSGIAGAVVASRGDNDKQSTIIISLEPASIDSTSSNNQNYDSSDSVIPSETPEE